MPDALPQQDGNDRVSLPRSAVWVNRIVWFAAIAGQLGFAVVVGIILANGGGGGRKLPTSALGGVGGAVLAFGLVLELRARCRGVGDTGDSAVLRREAFVIGPIAALDLASTMGLTVILLTGDPWPMCVVPAVSLLIQLWMFPRRTARRRRAHSVEA